MEDLNREVEQLQTETGDGAEAETEAEDRAEVEEASQLLYDVMQVEFPALFLADFNRMRKFCFASSTNKMTDGSVLRIGSIQINW